MTGSFWRNLRMVAAICTGGAVLALAVPARSVPADVPSVIDEAKVIGAWRLVRTEMQMPNGTAFPNPTYGTDPQGYIIYDKSHTMCVNLAAADVPSATPPGFVREGPSAAPSGANYCGRWRLNEARTGIIHPVEIVSGRAKTSAQFRKAWIDGDTLTIRSTLPRGLTDYYLQFERIR